MATKFKLFSYDELKVACHGFSSKNKVGEGGFGFVYKVNIFLLCFILFFITATLHTVSLRLNFIYLYLALI